LLESSQVQNWLVQRVGGLEIHVGGPPKQ
jgi:hypothetical protein